MRQTLSKADIYCAQKYIKNENKKYTDEFIEVEKEVWPIVLPKLFKVLRNRNFLVQCFQESDDITRLSINRTKILDNGDWSDRITWEEMQQIKNRLGYGNKMAVEIYPEERNIVNIANMRHLWILPEPLPFRWEKGVNNGQN